MKIVEKYEKGQLITSREIDSDSPKTDRIRERIKELGGWNALTPEQKDTILKILLGYDDVL